MHSLIISSNESGGGKTTFTLGLLKALMKRGYKVQGYKVGPDYIDGDFHTFITGNTSRNLDGHLMSEEGIKESYLRGQGDLGVIEGVMGLYDGKGIDTEFSTYHVSKILNLPIVLVITPKAKSATLAAELKGILEFKDANIAGIILNKVSEKYYNLLKVIIETHTKLKVFGYIPKTEEVKFKSRHLGLVQGIEIKDLKEKIDIFSNIIEQYVDLDSLIKSFRESDALVENRDKFKLKNFNLNIAVAYDEAFRFYYKENIELLKEAGNVKFFSPLRDKKLPKDIDFLYIGGGYPEIFKETLSENKELLLDIKEKLDKGLRCYAECGGLMYLTENIDGFEMVKYFNGYSYMAKSLNNFGYNTVKILKKNNMLPKDLEINAHEFHKSKVELHEETIYEIRKTDVFSKTNYWLCGYLKNNTLGSGISMLIPRIL
ncbi:cobyrinate a,c-diamide synthase [Paraclostridium bifermentans]|uniref:cobyrinate a,c-diamide synthase n=1 Tax=Paraclostridium bifermentans TaxID=1490 RepID=UPI0024322C3C|nr:cobyrinate a,c-diamide synthase [Paraclostridium bifermentans]